MSRSVKIANFEVSDLYDSTTAEDVVYVIIETEDCGFGEIKIGAVQTAPMDYASFE